MASPMMNPKIAPVSGPSSVRHREHRDQTDVGHDAVDPEMR